MSEFVYFIRSDLEAFDCLPVTSLCCSASTRSLRPCLLRLGLCDPLVAPDFLICALTLDLHLSSGVVHGR